MWSHLCVESSDHNKLKNKTNRSMNTQNKLTAVGRQGGDWMKEGEGTSQKHVYVADRHSKQCGDGQRERGAGARQVGKEGGNGDRKRLCLAWWAHDTMCRSCFLEMYTWNPYSFVNQCHPNKEQKETKKEKKGKEGRKKRRKKEREKRGKRGKGGKEGRKERGREREREKTKKQVWSNSFTFTNKRIKAKEITVSTTVTYQAASLSYLILTFINFFLVFRIALSHPWKTQNKTVN